MSALNGTSEIICGREFTSKKCLLEFIEQYEEKEYIQLMRTDSRTIDSARKRGFKRFINDDLQYTEITYRCIHSGIRKSKSKGKRPHQCTFRQGCPFNMQLRATHDGNALQVVKLIQDHNHPRSKELFQLLPKQQKLTDACGRHAPDANVTTSNIHAVVKGDPSGDALEKAVDGVRRRKPEAHVEVVRHADDDAALGVFYQDEEMRGAYRNHPEVLFVESLQKFCNRKAPFYYFSAADANGDAVVVAAFLSTSEEPRAVTAAAFVFRDRNDASDRTKTLMVDRDLFDVRVPAAAFAGAQLLISPSGTLDAFRQDVTPEELGVSADERDADLEVLRRMARAWDENEYDSALGMLTVPAVREYVEQRWHPLRDRWVAGLQRRLAPAYGDGADEFFAAKVTAALRRGSSLGVFFADLDTVLTGQRAAALARMESLRSRTPTEMPAHRSLLSYSRLLTPYSYALVEAGYFRRGAVALPTRRPYIVDSAEGTFEVTPDSCRCGFFLHVGLPCPHVLKVREAENLDIFCENVVAERWTRAHYLGWRRRDADDAERAELLNSLIQLWEESGLGSPAYGLQLGLEDSDIGFQVQA